MLAAGGFISDSSALAGTELYDPATGRWSAAGNLATPRKEHTATLLIGGQVLIAGGTSASVSLSTCELFAPPAPPAARQPQIAAAGPLAFTQPALAVAGALFHGDSETGSGTTQNSPANFPLIQLRSLDGSRLHTLAADPYSAASSLTVTELPASLEAGPQILTVIAAGVASAPYLLAMECSIATPQVSALPAAAVAIGQTVAFTAQAPGARRFQWEKNGIPIPGATAALYVTPPITAADAGTRFSVAVDSLCASAHSADRVLAVADDQPPAAALASPDGGEYWPLSSPAAPHQQIVAWTMSDNVRICQVEVALVYSQDGGATYLEAPAGGGLPQAFGMAGPAPFPASRPPASPTPCRRRRRPARSARSTR